MTYEKVVTRRQLLAGLSTGLMAGEAFLQTVETAHAAFSVSAGMPDKFVGPASLWLMETWGDVFRKRLLNTPFSSALLCAFACQESGYMWWTPLRKQYRPADLLRLLVLDNVTPRNAFPRDTQTFLKDVRYGEIAQDLIAASDTSREVRRIKKTGNLLFGYGLFQYDLQNIVDDPDFWFKSMPGRGGDVRGMWGDIGTSTDRFLKVLTKKYSVSGGDMDLAIARYNGGGSNAREYARIVRRFEQEALKAGVPES
ncbi:hypothetical protein [Acetobacter sp.]|uniref:hypothetical protein n=1 Tax=Acetobacter sp. TaxID=440 RepID=UPI0039EB37E0